MGEVVTKLNIASILKCVIEEIKPDNIINGFKTCGLYPFDENAINYTKCLATNNKEEEESKEENKMISLKDFESIIGDFSNIEIQSPINTTTNVNLSNEDNVTTVKLTTTPTKNIDLYLSTPSTTKDKPHFNKSINKYLQNLPVNKRKFIRKTEKNPYVITSENFRASIERREIEKQQKENETIERKRKRD
ncbi:unnamed protein product [Parnassius apollo]|uniref:(apollo) hypothetical protein n=1 Tax=Parnassius apollo TaxID=110799 RepID=A0A8S3XUP9_PARAO|nr:unnamed protein product [Parnassius apollo]